MAAADRLKSARRTNRTLADIQRVTGDAGAEGLREIGEPALTP
jgi:hypothetical protein